MHCVCNMHALTCKAFPRSQGWLPFQALTHICSWMNYKISVKNFLTSDMRGRVGFSFDCYKVKCDIFFLCKTASLSPTSITLWFRFSLCLKRFFILVDRKFHATDAHGPPILSFHGLLLTDVWQKVHPGPAVRLHLLENLRLKAFYVYRTASRQSPSTWVGCCASRWAAAAFCEQPNLQIFRRLCR